MGGLRDTGSQGIHGKHNSMQGRSVLRVTPHPPFIAFLGTFRVLNPWSEIYLFWDFSPFWGVLALMRLFWAPFGGF